jgi:alpha-beta hydrolase superfamily lysophospholipase
MLLTVQERSPGSRLISVSLFHSAMASASAALKNASSLKKPLLLMHGTVIRFVQVMAAGFAEAPPAELRLWEGAYHELHNDLCRHEVFDLIRTWVESKLS